MKKFSKRSLKKFHFKKACNEIEVWKPNFSYTETVVTQESFQTLFTI